MRSGPAPSRYLADIGHYEPRLAGVGKSWLACAIGHKACRDNRSVLYTRLPRLIDDLSLAKGDGRIAARMKSLARVDLLVLDDWGLEPLDGNARHHLLEILEDRYGRKSTLVTSPAYSVRPEGA